MSLIILNVDEVRRTLSVSDASAFVVNDKNVDIVRFALLTGFADVTLDEHSALRVMYQRPGETQVRAQTLTYYDTDGIHNFYDWELLSADLAEKGTLTVALCILRTDTEVEEWHTTPYQIRVLGSIHTDDSDEGDETITPTVAQRVAVLESMIQGVASGAPVVVSSMAEMTDTAQIYVLTTDGYWYYHDGSAWTAGGTYGAVGTDTTLTQPGVPADAKAVGDALAEAMTGEALEDGEVMKYIRVSKYDDFEIIDGYGYFDAKMLMNTICTNAPLASNTYNYIFRINSPDDMGRIRLLPSDFNTIGLLDKIFAPDFSFEEVEWVNAQSIGATEAGYFISKEPNVIRKNVYFSIPKDVYGESASIGECVFNVADTIGILMRTEGIEEYDPSNAITNATFGTISEVTREGELFYTGQINVNLWADVIGAADSANNRKWLWCTLGFLDSTSNYITYAKEFLNFAAGSNQARFYYTVKASNVAAKTAEAIKDYLVNVKQLRLYYIPEEAL